MYPSSFSKISVIAFSLLILTTKLTNCQLTSDHPESTKPSAVKSIAPTRSVTASAVPNMGRPGVLFYNLMSTNQAEVKFRVTCQDRATMYALSVFTSNTRVASILGDTSFNISCANAHKVHPTNESRIQSADTALSFNSSSGSLYPSQNASSFAKYDLARDANPQTVKTNFLGEVTGHFNVTLEAKNIGRSFFVILARKLSGPDYNVASSSSNDEASINTGGQGMANQGNTKRSKAPGFHCQLHKDQVGLSMVVVMQLPRTIDTVFRIVLRCVIVMATAGMGLKVDIQVVKQVLKKPIGPAIGFCCQFFCMPLIAYVVAKNIPQESAAVALGIFTCGVVPGGGLSNMFCFLLDADVSLSVTMTTISNIAALGMTPLWIFTLGSTFQDDQVALKVPYLKILETLAYVIVPLFVGIFIQIKFPKLEKLILKVLKPVVIVVVAGTIALGFYTNIHIFRMIRPMAILAGCLLPYCGYLTGALVSLVTCQTWKHVKTIAIETGIQNTTIAFMMLYLSLPPPDNQLATVGPAASAIMTPQPLFIIVIIYLIYKRCTRTEEDKGDRQDKEKEEEAVTAAQDLMSADTKVNGRGSGSKWTRRMTGGSGKSAVIVVWEKLTGVEKPDLVGEMLHQELIVPSPTSPHGKDEPA